jgi:hypothetical protein
VVRFSSEGDWRHVLSNGPWQFDFNVVLMKKYAGSVRPSDMVFNEMDIWVRVRDLPLDMMNLFYGKLIGGWIGEYICTDVDEEGLAWGRDLRIRVSVRVDKPLLRGVSIRESDDAVEGTWFDLQYEKVPHFCFDCGCLVHPDDMCPVERDEQKQQWGEWLRASPKRSYKPLVSARSVGSRSFDSENRGKGGVSVRDIPPRRNLAREFSYSGSSRTGAAEPSQISRRREQEEIGPGKGHEALEQTQKGNVNDQSGDRRKNQRGTFTRRPRNHADVARQTIPSVPQGNRKRGPKQVWMPVTVQVVGEGSSEVAGKRQRTSSVFDRIENPSDGSEGQRSTSVFDRIEDPAADPARQGRRAQ